MLNLSKEEIKLLIILISFSITLILSYFTLIKDNIKRIQEQINIILIRLERIEANLSPRLKPLNLKQKKKQKIKKDT